MEPIESKQTKQTEREVSGGMSGRVGISILTSAASRGKARRWGLLGTARPFDASPCERTPSPRGRLSAGETRAGPRWNADRDRASLMGHIFPNRRCGSISSDRSGDRRGRRPEYPSRHRGGRRWNGRRTRWFSTPRVSVWTRRSNFRYLHVIENKGEIKICPLEMLKVRVGKRVSLL